MPVFEYKGHNRSGRSVRGTVDADNQRTARIKLKKEGIYITELRNKQRAAQKKSNKRTISDKSVGVEDLSLMTRQLSTLVKANIPLVEALFAVSEQVENPILKEALSDLRNMVNEGSTLHRGLRKYPKIFNNIYVSMVEAGEMSGTLDLILLRLAEFTEAQNELNSKVKSAMTYPVIMLVFALGMLAMLFISVIPKITGIFEEAEMELPWYSELVIDFSDILVNYWHIIAIVAGALFFLFRSWKSSPNGSKQYDALLLKTPFVGKIARMVAVSRFTRTLATLLTGGVPMLMALDIVRNVVNNYVLSKAIEGARDNIREGESIAAPLKASGEFPPLVIHMISIGEKTGELENMLTQVSNAYDFQVKNSIEGITSILNPVMIIFMGGVIGVIVFAILVPIMDMANIAQ